ncbi:MAG: hypothetical protein AAF390_15525 [Pseudomonadota bacterium]
MSQFRALVLVIPCLAVFTYIGWRNLTGDPFDVVSGGPARLVMQVQDGLTKMIGMTATGAVFICAGLIFSLALWMWIGKILRDDPAR